MPGLDSRRGQDLVDLLCPTLASAGIPLVG
jgi:hypothetical protein